MILSKSSIAPAQGVEDEGQWCCCSLMGMGLRGQSWVDGALTVPDLLLAQPALASQTARTASSPVFWCFTPLDLREHPRLQSHLLQLARPCCLCTGMCFPCSTAFSFLLSSVSVCRLSLREPAPGSELLPGSLAARSVCPPAQSHQCWDAGASRTDGGPRPTASAHPPARGEVQHPFFMQDNCV